MLRTSSFATLLFTAVLAPNVHAAGGTGSYTLPWSTHGEVLEYRSCGCGDSCWVAELRDARTKALKARLRCDCERLHATVGPRGKERAQAASCPVGGDGIDKPQAIGEAMQRLLRR